MDNEPKPDDEKLYQQRPYKTGGYQQHGGRDRVQNRTVELLPHPEVLESYNYVVDGSAKMILTMFELEQKHRHEWEFQALSIQKFSAMLGQILGFLIAVVLFVSASVIAICGNATTAAILWMSGLAIVVVAGLIWSYARAMGEKPLLARTILRKHERQDSPETE